MSGEIDLNEFGSITETDTTNHGEDTVRIIEIASTYNELNFEEEIIIEKLS